MRVVIAFNEIEAPESKSPLDLSQEDVFRAVTAVQQALQRLGAEVLLVPIGHDPADFLVRLRALRPDVIFNHCEAMLGRSDRELHAATLLDLAGAPVTGSPAFVVGVLLDKAMVKRLLTSEGLPTPPFALLHDERDLERLSGLDYPLILKPACEDASIGLDADSVVHTHSDAARVMARLAGARLLPVLAEGFIAGREINALAIGGEAPTRILYGEIDYTDLPPGAPPILTYRGKWDPSSDEFNLTPAIYPASVEPELEAELERLVTEGWRLLGCRGFVRFDFRIDGQRRPWILEVNPNPDLSPGAGAQRALAAADIAFERFIEGVIHEAIERHGRELQRAASRATGSTGH
jgi:D-alanine-D-alanine ligase